MELEERYREKLGAAEEIVALVESGWSCCTDIAAAVPPALMNALGARGRKG